MAKWPDKNLQLLYYSNGFSIQKPDTVNILKFHNVQANIATFLATQKIA